MTTTPNLQAEVAFIGGVNSLSTLVQTAFYGWNGNTPATYASTYTSARKWGSASPGTSGGTLSYYFNSASNWTSTEQQWLSAGLALWSALANITFAKTTSSSGADIVFNRDSSGTSETYVTYNSLAGAGLIGGSTLNQIAHAQTSIDTSVGGFGPINGFGSYGGYPILNLLHEEGHALGLGHAGPYDGSVNVSTQQFSAYDSRLWSIMSYIDPTNTSAAYYSQYPVTGVNWGGHYPTTPMPADILAIQRLYGLPSSTPLSGGQVFGFHTNVTGAIEPFYDFTKNTNPVVTIWDKGASNTLDLSGFSGSATVNLSPGTFSSADGMKDNIAIAYGTSINTLYCTSGGDTVCVNSGNDTIHGGSGSDTVVFSGNSTSYTIAHNSDGTTTVSGNGATDVLSSIETLKFADKSISNTGTLTTSSSSLVPARRDFNGDYRNDMLLVSGGSVQEWLMNGTSISAKAQQSGPGSGWVPLATGDFNADGKADILWKNSSLGQLKIWMMNGDSVASAQNVSTSVPSGWQAIGAGDFNGDGKADILFRNTNGQADIWIMNGSTQVSGAYAGPNLGTSWKVVAIGDFNGDHKSDLLWENPSTGQLQMWLMNGASVSSSATLSYTVGSGWRVVGAGDFNADGKADILFQNSNGQCNVWEMSGATRLSSTNAGSNLGSSWRAITDGDFNGDGKTDILYRNPSTGQFYVQLMSGTTSLSTSAAIGNNPGTAWYAMAG